MEAPIYHLEGVVKARAEEELGDFTGPLDLILHLLSKNRMEIKDIQIAVILDLSLRHISSAVGLCRSSTIMTPKVIREGSSNQD